MSYEMNKTQWGSVMLSNMKLCPEVDYLPVTVYPKVLFFSYTAVICQHWPF